MKYTISPEDKWHIARMTRIAELEENLANLPEHTWGDFMNSYDAIQARIKLAHKVNKPEYADTLKKEIQKINR